MRTSALWRGVFQVFPRRLAQLGWLSGGWQDGLGACPNTPLPKSSAQITASAHRGVVFTCTLASLCDILLLLSDVCLPLN